MSNKTRLDVLLTERGLAESRQKAQAVIMAGHVFVAGQRVDKPGTAVLSDAPIEVRGHALPYVSRGGLKLEKAMKTFPITLTDKICADIGASTGGFTDCMLQNGARKVYSVDVGYGQLDWKLRSDPRVVCMERTNARYLTPEQIPDPLDFASIDVSFISLTYVIPVIARIAAPGASVVLLVKPQFEVGKGNLGKGGIVEDRHLRDQALETVVDCANQHGLTVAGTAPSPIEGTHGNTEFLLFARMDDIAAKAD